MNQIRQKFRAKSCDARAIFLKNCPGTSFVDPKTWKTNLFPISHEVSFWSICYCTSCKKFTSVMSIISSQYMKKVSCQFWTENPRTPQRDFFFSKISIHNFLYTYFANNCTTFGAFSEFCGNISSAKYCKCSCLR